MGSVASIQKPKDISPLSGVAKDMQSNDTKKVSPVWQSLS